ncbi:predicted protein [Coccidioides posadasii str. Silveira]|uniref:Predicted protein n=1 Tax=Coccidioides posadasii (strain RMSCC 757 / Silveira) TaxID=443226 RepID=E9DCP3_COCPS|nr:predicted protein [Coccidioides posadasii str. Silveira]
MCGSSCSSLCQRCHSTTSRFRRRASARAVYRGDKSTLHLEPTTPMRPRRQNQRK